MVKLDIISDPICPWCYIGKAQLDRALEANPDHPFTVEWHPFQLNPEMPKGGMDRRTYLEAKFGGQQGAVTAYLPVAEHAERIGLEINFEAIKRTPNTLDAHRLIHWAGIEGCQTPVVGALFRAYFQDGRDLENHDILADIADSAGMDASVILRLLQSDSDIEAVRSRDSSAREMGVNSVPTFIVNGQHAVPGMQSTDLWNQVISDIRSQMDAAE